MFSESNKENSETHGLNYLANVSDLMAAFLFILFLSVAFLLFRLTALSDTQGELLRTQTELLRLARENKSLKETLAEAKERAVDTVTLIEEKKTLEEKLERLGLKAEGLEKLNSRLTKVSGKLMSALKDVVGANAARAHLLDSIERKLVAEGLEIQVDPSIGVLRLPEKAITFESGKAGLNPKYLERIKGLGDVLARELVCYDAQKKKSPECLTINPLGTTLDAVFIEGHTDNQPFGGDTTGARNRALSAARANTVFSELMNSNSWLQTLKNPKGQPLFSLSGYGEERPLEGHKHAYPQSDEANRRIEIRFLMRMPEISDEEYKALEEHLDLIKDI